MGDFYWEWLRLAFSMPYAIAEIIGFAFAIIFGLIVWKRPKWEGKLKHLLWQIPLAVLIGGFTVGAIVAPYNIYKDRQNEITSIQAEFDQYREEHKPIIVIDVNNIEVNNDKEQQIVTITMNIILKNIGDRPAYETRFRQCAAPLNYPENISAVKDLVDTNPIYEGIPLLVPFEYKMNYIVEDGKQKVPSNRILIYTDLKWSDTPNGQRWYEQSFWNFFDLNVQRVASVFPEQKYLFEPLVKSFYGNETQ